MKDTPALPTIEGITLESPALATLQLRHADGQTSSRQLPLPTAYALAGRRAGGQPYRVTFQGEAADFVALCPADLWPDVAAALAGELPAHQIRLRPLLLDVSITDAQIRAIVQQGRPVALVAPCPVMVGMTERSQEVDVDILDCSGRLLFSFSASKGSPALATICRELVADHADPLASLPAVLSAGAGALVVEGNNGHQQRLTADQLQQPRLVVHWSGSAALVTGGQSELAYFVPADLVESVKVAVPAALVATS